MINNLSSALFFLWFIISRCGKLENKRRFNFWPFLVKLFLKARALQLWTWGAIDAGSKMKVVNNWLDTGNGGKSYSCGTRVITYYIFFGFLQLWPSRNLKISVKLELSARNDTVSPGIGKYGFVVTLYSVRWRWKRVTWIINNKLFTVSCTRKSVVNYTIICYSASLDPVNIDLKFVGC